MKPCKVYRSDKKAETYLYLAEDMEFDDLPTHYRSDSACLPSSCTWNCQQTAIWRGWM